MIERIFFVLALFFSSHAYAGKFSVKLISVDKIWDTGRHSAFTDLIKFNGTWYCAFREADKHVGNGINGVVKILASADTVKWTLVKSFSGEGDLRDPKLSITPKGKLMLIYFQRFFPSKYPAKHERQFVRFMDKNGVWSNEEAIGDEDAWLWRVTWHNGKAYGVSRSGVKGKKPFTFPRVATLFRSSDGVNYLPLSHFSGGGETTIQFRRNTAYMLRNTLTKSQKKVTFWGRASEDFSDLKWIRLDRVLGGSNFVITSSNQFIGLSREVHQLGEGNRILRTYLFEINPKTGKHTMLLKLPSYGDNGYAGIVEEDDMLYVSFYSSDNDEQLDQTAIYLAKIQIVEKNDFINTNK